MHKISFRLQDHLLAAPQAKDYYKPLEFEQNSSTLVMNNVEKNKLQTRKYLKL